MTSSRLKCPVCKKLTDKSYHPFCSLQCSEIDLGRWLGGKYIIPGPPLTEDDDLEHATRPDEEE